VLKQGHTGPTANAAWLGLLRDVYDWGAEVKPRGLTCREILANTSVVDMNYPIVTARPKLGYKFLTAEAWWILTGRNDVESIKPYSPHIASFSNDGVRFDGAYGPRIIDQLRFIVDTLEGDWESRQAVLEIWRPNPRPSKDIPCTVSVQWMVRRHVDGAGLETFRLHCFDTMRSSDTWLGWPYDVFNFSMLSAYVALMLRDRVRARNKDHAAYELVRPLENLRLGSLHLTAASQHLYVHPKQDGATNIPYSLDDVANALAGDTHKPASYSPVNLDEYEKASDLLLHLSYCKDGEGRLTGFLSEFQGARRV